jgi:hypothetical protein
LIVAWTKHKGSAVIPAFKTNARGENEGRQKREEKRTVGDDS